MYECVGVCVCVCVCVWVGGCVCLYVRAYVMCIYVPSREQLRKSFFHELRLFLVINKLEVSSRLAYTSMVIQICNLIRQ